MTDTDLERSFGFILHETARLLSRRFDQRVKSIGLTRAQCQALAYLARNEGINQTGLAELMDIECISLARLVDRMEQAGWVERRPDPTDRRARLLFMTEKAKPIFARIRAVGQEVRKEALAGLPAGDAEHLLDLLLQVRANLSDRPEAAAAREAVAVAP
jgi:DNA-binding MarR family transcriptional regulator